MCSACTMASLCVSSKLARRDVDDTPCAAGLSSPVKNASWLHGSNLVLQLPLLDSLALSVGFCCDCLMRASPERPGEDEGRADRGPQEQSGEQVAQLGGGQTDGVGGAQAARVVAGLLSFGLLAVLRMLAASLARKAAAAMHRVMWRCQPCQERASQWSTRAFSTESSSSHPASAPDHPATINAPIAEAAKESRKPLTQL